jgi:hypothetical protein
MYPISSIVPNTAIGIQSSASTLSATSATTDTTSSPPSVAVNLSENAKAALAAANENQDAANRILTFVDANRSGHSHRTGRANRDWSDGAPYLEHEYQQLAGRFSQNPSAHQPSPGDVLTITLSEYTNASLSVESGSGAGASSATVDNTQYDSVSLSVNINSGSIQIAQSDQSQTETAAQLGSASLVSITA